MIQNEAQRSFKNTFVNQIWKSKLIIISTVFVAILSYGFAITNFSVGIDDPLAMRYLHSDAFLSMIQQGRLSHVVLEALTGCVTFLPFFNDFVAVGLFVVSAWILCAFFQYVTNDAFSSWQLAAFSGVYLSYPIINEKFIYNLDIIVTMLSYLCFALALLFAYQFVFENNRKSSIWAVLNLIISISSFESFPFLYVSGVFFLFLLKIFVNREHITVKELIAKGIQFALILLLSMILYYSTVYVVQIATNQYGVYEQYSVWRNSDNLWATFKKVLMRIVRGMTQTSYFPILVFDIAATVGLVLFCGFAIAKRNVSCALCVLGLYFSNLILPFVVGEVLYRTALGFGFFVAGIVLCVLYGIEKLRATRIRKYIYNLMCVLVLLLIFVQAGDLNKWFYNDYTRYKKEEFAVNAIATRLVAECDITKPVVFTNPDYHSYLYSSDGINQTNGNSMLMWGIDAFYEIQSQSMIEIFKIHGYDFIQQPTLEQAEAGQISSETMEAWPKRGSIQEFDDYIVVNFAEKQ